MNDLEAQTILREVASAYPLTVPELKGRSRTRHIVVARQEAMHLLARQGWSTPRIGRLLGRDHSTVLHGIEAHKRRNDAKVRKVPDPPSQKMCSRCRTVKPASAFWRHNRSTGDGLQGWCKPCVRDDKRAKAGTGKTKRTDGRDRIQISMVLDASLVEALRATSDDRGEMRSAIVERAVARELRRIWMACMRCESRPRLEEAQLCGPCLHAQVKAGAA